MKQITDHTHQPVNPAYIRLARDFENAAETLREFRIHGPAADAEARKGVCEYLVAARSER
jgi:hypothetical protein